MGIFTDCDRVNNEVLQGAKEADKLAFAAATTILLLIPLMVSVSRLPTANIQELVLTGNNTIAIITAGYTFGLPVMQVSRARAVQAADYLKDDFTWNMRAVIMACGPAT
jgi:uncharacterized membrane protein YjfL (UPF0719 family)